MQTVLEQAKSPYELVVIDTPPLTAVSDAFPLLSMVDGIIVVGRIGRNRRDAEDLHETLRAAKAPLLGVVANGFKARGHTPYAYGYYGNEGSPPAPRRKRGGLGLRRGGLAVATDSEVTAPKARNACPANSPDPEA